MAGITRQNYMLMERPTLKDLMTHARVPDHWYILGVFLEVDTETLQSIKRKECSEDEKLTEMYSEYLQRNPHASREAVITALEQKSVGHNTTAQRYRDELKKKYEPECESESSVSSSEPTASPEAKADRGRIHVHTVEIRIPQCGHPIYTEICELRIRLGKLYNKVEDKGCNVNVDKLKRRLGNCIGTFLPDLAKSETLPDVIDAVKKGCLLLNIKSLECLLDALKDEGFDITDNDISDIHAKVTELCKNLPQMLLGHEIDRSSTDCKQFVFICDPNINKKIIEDIRVLLVNAYGQFGIKIWVSISEDLEGKPKRIKVCIKSAACIIAGCPIFVIGALVVLAQISGSHAAPRTQEDKHKKYKTHKTNGTTADDVQEEKNSSKLEDQLLIDTHYRQLFCCHADKPSLTAESKKEDCSSKQITATKDTSSTDKPSLTAESKKKDRSSKQITATESPVSPSNSTWAMSYFDASTAIARFVINIVIAVSLVKLIIVVVLCIIISTVYYLALSLLRIIIFIKSGEDYKMSYFHKKIAMWISPYMTRIFWIILLICFFLCIYKIWLQNIISLQCYVCTCLILVGLTIILVKCCFADASCFFCIGILMYFVVQYVTFYLYIHFIESHLREIKQFIWAHIDYGYYAIAFNIGLTMLVIFNFHTYIADNFDIIYSWVFCLTDNHIVQHEKTEIEAILKEITC